jgi:hypothetical protein
VVSVALAGQAELAEWAESAVRDDPAASAASAVPAGPAVSEVSAA